jgi:hypothetical protein
VQAELRQKRSAVKDLQGRIQLLESTGNESDESEESAEDEDSDEDNPVASFAPKISGMNGGYDIEPTSVQEGAEHLASTLRSRRTGGANAPSRTTGSSYNNSTTNDDPNSLQTKEKLLSSDRVEQEAILGSLLSLTRQLKASQTTFHHSLSDEKKHLDLAAQGLDRNVEGMDAAGRRMGTLRRMTEGKGWFGRLMLYAWVAGLWVLALVIVFVLPKLRF